MRRPESVDVSELLAVALERFGRPGTVVADRWREKELADALNAAQVPAADLHNERPWALETGAPIVFREFRRACIDGQVQALSGLLLLPAALRGAVTVTDPAGNSRSLRRRPRAGRRQAHRDDAAAAAILAIAIGRRAKAHTAGQSRPLRTRSPADGAIARSRARWRRVRRQALDRDGWRCQCELRMDCHGPGKHLRAWSP